jgi:hypothetical protein
MKDVIQNNIGLGAWIIGEAALQNIDVAVDIMVGFTALLLNVHMIGKLIKSRRKPKK